MWEWILQVKLLGKVALRKMSSWAGLNLVIKPFKISLQPKLILINFSRNILELLLKSSILWSKSFKCWRKSDWRIVKRESSLKSSRTEKSILSLTRTNGQSISQSNPALLQRRSSRSTWSSATLRPPAISSSLTLKIRWSFTTRCHQTSQ